MSASHVTVAGRMLTVEVAASGGNVEASVDGHPLRATIERDGTAWRITMSERTLYATVVRDRDAIWVAVGGEIHRCTVTEGVRAEAGAAPVHPPEVIAPMPGKVLEVAVRVGQDVVAGDALVVLEAMKMETVLTAEAAARVVRVHVSPGAMVEPGQILIELAYD